MDERDLKRAIESIHPAPGMEARIHRAVMQGKPGTHSRGRHQKPRMFQGSVVAAACCVIAAVVVIVTSFHTGSFTAILGGPQVQGELSPAAPGYTQSQAEQDPYEIVVEWNRSTHIAVSEGVASQSGDSSITGTWYPQPDENTQDGWKAVAVVSATDGNKTYGSKKYLTATYHQEDQTLSIEVSDQPVR